MNDATEITNFVIQFLPVLDSGEAVILRIRVSHFATMTNIPIPPLHYTTPFARRLLASMVWSNGAKDQAYKDEIW